MTVRRSWCARAQCHPHLKITQWRARFIVPLYDKDCCILSVSGENILDEYYTKVKNHVIASGGARFEAVSGTFQKKSQNLWCAVCSWNFVRYSCFLLIYYLICTEEHGVIFNQKDKPVLQCYLLIYKLFICWCRTEFLKSTCRKLHRRITPPQHHLAIPLSILKFDFRRLWRLRVSVRIRYQLFDFSNMAHHATTVEAKAMRQSKLLC